jgi:hypothetical protein
MQKINYLQSEKTKMNSLLPLPALMIGLLGNVHCLGMCGGLSGALAFSNSGKKNTKTLLGYQLLYNLGRISTYSLLGLVAGSVGGALKFTLGHYGALSLRMTAGLLIVSLGFYITGWWRGLSKLERIGATVWRKISPLLKKLTPRRNPVAAILIGMLWGFLPCGLVYSTLSLSVASGSPLTGLTTMAFFGIGTLPSMFATGFFAERLVHLVRLEKVQVCSGLTIILFGIWTMSGMALAPLMMMGHHHM